MIKKSFLILLCIFLLSFKVYAEKKEIVVGAKSSTPISHGIEYNGLVYTSGQLGSDANGQLGVGIEEQTKNSLNRIKAVLEAGGSSLDKAIKVNIFVKDLNDYDKINKIYATYFKTSFPVRTLVEVARIPMDGLIEIEAIGHK